MSSYDDLGIYSGLKPSNFYSSLQHLLKILPAFLSACDCFNRGDLVLSAVHGVFLSCPIITMMRNFLYWLPTESLERCWHYNLAGAQGAWSLLCHGTRCWRQGSFGHVKVLWYKLSLHGPWTRWLIFGITKLQATPWEGKANQVSLHRFRKTQKLEQLFWEAKQNTWDPLTTTPNTQACDLIFLPVYLMLISIWSSLRWPWGSKKLVGWL